MAEDRASDLMELGRARRTKAKQGHTGPAPRGGGWGPWVIPQEDSEAAIAPCRGMICVGILVRKTPVAIERIIGESVPSSRIGGEVVPREKVQRRTGNSGGERGVMAVLRNQGNDEEIGTKVKSSLMKTGPMKSPRTPPKNCAVYGRQRSGLVKMRSTA